MGKDGLPIGKQQLLDPNHSHFILVDDAYHDFRGEVKFRAALEKKITEAEKKVPIVVLVIGGGPGTAESVYEAVDKGSPCVFLDVSLRWFLTFFILDWI